MRRDAPSLRGSYQRRGNYQKTRRHVRTIDDAGREIEDPDVLSDEEEDVEDDQ